MSNTASKKTAPQIEATTPLAYAQAYANKYTSETCEVKIVASTGRARNQKKKIYSYIANRGHAAAAKVYDSLPLVVIDIRRQHKDGLVIPTNDYSFGRNDDGQLIPMTQHRGHWVPAKVQCKRFSLDSILN